MLINLTPKASIVNIVSQGRVLSQHLNTSNYFIALLITHESYIITHNSTKKYKINYYF